MRRLITDGVELVGLGCLTIGAADWAGWAGWVVGGASLLFAGARFGARGPVADPAATRDAIVRRVIAARQDIAA